MIRFFCGVFYSVFLFCLVMFVNCLVNWLAFCLGVIAV